MKKPEKKTKDNHNCIGLCECETYNQAIDDYEAYHQEVIGKMYALVKAVLDWWEEHQYDTISFDAGDNYTDEYNVYDGEPEFVKIAKKLRRV